LLFGQRKRLEAIAEAEAAGSSFWTTEFAQEVRTKFIHLFSDASNEHEAYYVVARGLILRDEGKLFLDREDWDARNDLLHYSFKCEDDIFPSVIEAMISACVHPMIMQGYSEVDAARFFERESSRILREHRISYELVNRQMVKLSSRELHKEVVAPAMILLAGRPDLDKVEEAYAKSLKEISGGDPADAITDAGTALQEMLGSLGCTGGSLGPLIKSARSKGLLAPHDGPLLDAVDRVMNWVSADRSETGDAHKASSASLDDAWFMVHIVGAIILRLSAGPRKSS
jgi:hypothetical protein